jgi:hypothetical protein
MCYIVPYLRLFVPNSLQAYRYFFFSEGCACDLCDQSRLPSLWLGFHGDYSPTASTAPSLRPLIPSSSQMMCKLVQVYHYQPRSRVPWWLVLAEVPRVIDAPASLTLKLLVVSSLVSERADHSTMSSHTLLITKWKSPLLASWPPVWKSAWQSCWMSFCFLDVAALLGLGPLCRCCIPVAAANFFRDSPLSWVYLFSCWQGPVTRYRSTSAPVVSTAAS